MNCKPGTPCYEFAGKLESMSPRLNKSVSPEGYPIVEASRKTSMRRRSVNEALARVKGAGSPLWKTGKRYPFTKPYAYALQGLTYALVLVDPLDRLDGGLID